MSIPLNTHLPQSSLPHCVFGTSSHAYIPKFTSLLWLTGERETFPRRSGVRGKMCAQGDAKSFRQVLCVLTDSAEGFCSDLSQTWYWQMLCKLPTQHWQCLLRIWPATTTPPWPPSLSPLSPGQHLSWAERALPARLRGGSLMWTDGTRGAGYICSLNSSTFAIVCKWVRALGGWETMGLGSKYSFPVMCSKVNLCCVIKFDTDEENTCWCKQLASLPAEAQILCRTSANAFFSPVGKGPSEEACLRIPFHSFTASGCLFWDSAWI